MGEARRPASEGAARILIVDDHPAVREGLGIRIDRQEGLVVCGEASGISEALRLVDSTDPDLVVIDISLAEGDGIDLIHRVRARSPRARMLVWSMYPESLYAERALRAGALGYITKQQATGQIIEAIRTVLDGRMYLSGPLADRLLRRGVFGGGKSAPSSIETLTDRELEVFRLIGAGKTTSEIAAQLHRSVHTIETYRQRIKAKLDLHSYAELARAAAQWTLEHG